MQQLEEGGIFSKLKAIRLFNYLTMALILTVLIKMGQGKNRIENYKNMEQLQSPKKVAGSDATAAFWNDFAPNYMKAEIIHFQGALTGFLMTRVELPGQRVLEVASGSGTHAEIVAQSFLSRKGQPVYVACDFSVKFIEMLRERFEKSEYAEVSGNIFDIDCQNDYTSNGQTVDLDALVESKGEFKKAVFGHRASGTDLPYPDAWFDCYVSNLCLQLVDDPNRMLLEAYRVLKPGSKACFTVWGRRENSLLFQLEDLARKSLGKEPIQSEVLDSCVRSNFDYAEEIKEHEAVFKGVGFSQIKYWYQPQNFPYRSGKEFLENAVNKHSFTKDPEIRAEMERIYDEQSGLSTSDMRTWEVMVILAFKD